MVRFNQREICIIGIILISLVVSIIGFTFILISYKNESASYGIFIKTNCHLMNNTRIIENDTIFSKQYLADGNVTWKNPLTYLTCSKYIRTSSYKRKEDAMKAIKLYEAPCYCLEYNTCRMVYRKIHPLAFLITGLTILIPGTIILIISICCFIRCCNYHSSYGYTYSQI